MFKCDREKGYNTWARDIKTVFESLDLGAVYSNNSICNMVVFEQQLTNYDSKQWTMEIMNKPKLRLLGLEF